jgi:hypothetical protein
MRPALAPAWRSILDIAIIAFDNFTDLDLFLPWDLLNRVKDLGSNVRIFGDKRNTTLCNGDKTEYIESRRG